MQSNNNKSSKMSKLKSPSSGVSPLMMKYFSSNSSSNSNSSSPGDPFSPRSKMSLSSSSSSTSNSSTPLSAVEEDVLVMDGILLNSSSSPLYPGGNIDGGFSKTELCRSWEDFGNSRFGTKCQFAHGKEELRLSRFQVTKSKSDAQICRSYIAGSCIYGSKCRFLHHQVITDSALVLTTQMPSPIKLPHEQTPKTTITAPVTFKSPGTSTTAIIKPTKNVEPTRTISSKDYWLPQDDGIQVSLPCLQSPSREEVDAYIAAVLYHQTARRRLPVFTQTCPD